MDLIDREQAIAALEDLKWYHIYNGELKAGANSKDNTPLYKAEDVYAALRKVPSAEKTGEWIPYSQVYENRNLCSECGYHLVGTHASEAHYCPNCGARMVAKNEID